MRARARACVCVIYLFIELNEGQHLLESRKLGQTGHGSNLRNRQEQSRQSSELLFQTALIFKRSTINNLSKIHNREVRCSLNL